MRPFIVVGSFFYFIVLFSCNFEKAGFVVVLPE